MKPATYLSLLVFVIGTLGWTAWAQNVPEFTAELTRLKNVYEDDLVSQSIKLKTIPALMDFYEKYSHWLRITPRGRVTADDALKVYKELGANQIQEDGVTSQGLWKATVFEKIDVILNILYTQPDPRQPQNQMCITNGKDENIQII